MNNTAQSVFSSGLTDGSHTLRFDVERTPNEGWRVREQRDAEVVRQVVYGDWHRVELAIRGSASKPGNSHSEAGASFAESRKSTKVYLPDRQSMR